MLSSARLQTLVCTADIARGRRFYSEILGLRLKCQSHGADVYDVGEADLRLSPVPSTKRSEHTVVGFAVEDLDAVAEALQQKGVATERFPGFQHDVRGVWRAPDGARVLWIRDPDGNLLSVVQYAR
ncbi:MAG: VOC family protein [Caulobacteraceae bacterium]|nr:VOC family protein [Caulobacteraceae bacterium]